MLDGDFTVTDLPVSQPTPLTYSTLVLTRVAVPLPGLPAEREPTEGQPCPAPILLCLNTSPAAAGGVSYALCS